MKEIYQKITEPGSRFFPGMPLYYSHQIQNHFLTGILTYFFKLIFEDTKKTFLDVAVKLIIYQLFDKIFTYILPILYQNSDETLI